MAANELSRAYKWALEHGYDPSSGQINTSMVGNSVQPVPMEQVGVELGTSSATATDAGEYGQMNILQAQLQENMPGVYNEEVSVRVTPLSPPPSPSPQQQQQHGVTLTIGSPPQQCNPPVSIAPATPQYAGPDTSAKHDSTEIFPETPAPRTQATLFESMIAGSVPCKAIYGDELCGVIVDANPQAPLHLLIFPKRRANMHRITTITDPGHTQLLGHMIGVARVRCAYTRIILYYIIYQCHCQCRSRVRYKCVSPIYLI